MPKVLMLHCENSAVGLYRVWMQAKYLKRMGWDVVRVADKHPVISIDDWERLSTGIDLIVCQRSDNPDVIALMMGLGDLRDCPVVYETDDDIFDVSVNSPAYEYFYPGSPLIEVSEVFMRACAAVTTSTPVLAELYKKQNPNVYLLPNAQDPEMWEGLSVTHPEGDAGKVVIGWAGSTTHFDDLKLIERPIKKILRNNPNVIFRVFGMIPDFLLNHPQVDVIGGWAETYQWPAKLASLGFDIGVAPLTFRPFNNGKSPIKFQEYAMLGIPTVASKVGPYLEIESQVTGLTADSEQAWYNDLEKLVKNEKLRKEIGENAKRYVLKNNNLALSIKDWDAAYRDIIRKHGKQAKR